MSLSKLVLSCCLRIKPFTTLHRLVNRKAVWKHARAQQEQSFYNELQQTMETSLGGIDDALLTWKVKELNLKSWKLIVHETSDKLPPTSEYSVIGPSNTIFLLFQPSHGCNFGHFMWDNLLSLFSMMDLYDLADKDAIVPSAHSTHGGKSKECHSKLWWR